MKKFISVLLCILMFSTMLTFGASAGKISMNIETPNVDDTYTLAVGSKAVVVGRGTVINNSAVTGVGMNILGWKRNTTTLDNMVAIIIPSAYTGYITISTVRYSNGAAVLSSSRSKGTKDASNANYPTWYKELTKSSYTNAVTSYATVESSTVNSDYYYGTPNVVNAHR